MQYDLEEIRCCHCHRLLARGQVIRAEFKCPRCGAYTIVRAGSPDHAPLDGQTTGYSHAHCGQPVQRGGAV
ncbi:MAG: Com family DNA-binding transcriptional regulator [Desulfovibrio sp.]|nr:Com family DNA-binding transcriptional regulator [Desulfovibrio sp.]